MHSLSHSKTIKLLSAPLDHAQFSHPKQQHLQQHPNNTINHNSILSLLQDHSVEVADGVVRRRRLPLVLLVVVLVEDVSEDGEGLLLPLPPPLLNN